MYSSSLALESIRPRNDIARGLDQRSSAWGSKLKSWSMKTTTSAFASIALRSIVERAQEMYGLPDFGNDTERPPSALDRCDGRFDAIDALLGAASRSWGSQ
jgi:hypothetical protein